MAIIKGGMIMKLLTQSMFLVLLLSYSSIRAYSFSQNGIWVGGAIIVNINCPDEIKGGDSLYPLNIDISVLQDVHIEYFIIKIEQFYSNIYSDTLWQNQNLNKDFKYSDTLSIKTKNTIIGSDNLRLIINAKYSDAHWIYTISTMSFDIDIVRNRFTYNELDAAYSSLESNYSSLILDHNSLKWDYSYLNSTYNQLNKQYWDLVSEYDSLQWNMSVLETTLNSTREEITNTRLELETARSSLNAAYGQIATWQIATAVAFILGLTTMYTIGKRRKIVKSKVANSTIPPNQ